MFATKGVLSKPSMLNNVQILAVDNDRDSGTLYSALLENYGVVMTVTESVKEALDLLNGFVPDILICETRFLGESVYPLIQKVRSIAQNSHKVIPIFVTSTYLPMNLAEYLKVRVEAYQIKPIDLDAFIDEVWNLVALSKTPQPNSLQDWLLGLNVGEASCV